MGKTSKCFFIKTRNRPRVSISPFQIVLKVLARAMRQGNKGFGKKRSECLCGRCHDPVCERPQDSNKKLSKVDKHHQKSGRMQIEIQKLVAFPYNSEECTKKSGKQACSAYMHIYMHIFLYVLYTP